MATYPITTTYLVAVSNASPAGLEINGIRVAPGGAASIPMSAGSNTFSANGERAVAFNWPSGFFEYETLAPSVVLSVAQAGPFHMRVSSPPLYPVRDAPIHATVVNDSPAGVLISGLYVAPFSRAPISVMKTGNAFSAGGGSVVHFGWPVPAFAYGALDGDTYLYVGQLGPKTMSVRTRP